MNFIHSKEFHILGMFAIAITLFLGVVAFASSAHAQTPITICHSTNSDTNPYNQMTPDDVSSHFTDDGPIWYEGIEGKWGDIIPSFGEYPGMNWTEEGQAIYGNDCNVGGTITVNKVVVGNEEVEDDDFNLKVDNKKVDDEESNPFNLGTYTVTETPKDETPTDYTATFSGDCDQNGSITLDTLGQNKTCTITNDYTPEPTTGTLKITKYACPSDTVVVRSQNGVGGTVPEECELQAGAYFGYVHGDQTDANAPYPELDETPTPAGVTDGSGILEVAGLSTEGRYLVVETNDANEKLPHDAILGLYCEGDGDTSDNNDNQELTFIYENETSECIAYNIEEDNPEPEYCTLTMVSGSDANEDDVDDATTVVEKSGAFAKLLSWIHPAWTAVISSAEWVWGDDPVADPSIDETQTFERTFGWNGPVVSATLEIASDNSHEYDLNGTTGGDASEHNFALANQDTYDVTGAVAQGTNNLSIAVKNWEYDTSDPQVNPAGLLYKLTVVGTDPDCAPPIEEPEIETIELCKRDVTGAPISGWGMTLTNGETTYELTTGETGCITQEVDAAKGPWVATEENRAGWDLTGVDPVGGVAYYDQMQTLLGCEFFGAEPVLRTVALDIRPEIYGCTFVNTENPYSQCLTENLLVNGSFEEPVINSDWSLISNPIGWITKKVADAVDTVLEFHRGWSGNVAADGAQYVELGGTEPAYITQAVATEEGAQYQLWWAFAPRQDTVAEENMLSVLVNGSEVATEGPTAGVGVLAEEDWTQGSYVFTAGANTDVSFKDAGTGPLGSYGTFVDATYLCKIQDPSNDSDDNDSSTTSSGGGCRNCGDNDDDDDDSDTNDDEDEDSGDEDPEGEVQGVQTMKVPTVAGASTGAGGTSPRPYEAIPFVALTAMLASMAVLRTTRVNEL